MKPLSYLNDNLVDLYLKYMALEAEFVPPRTNGATISAELLQSRAGDMNIFTTHFYKKLTEATTAEAHGLVARWTKLINLFSKRLFRFLHLYVSQHHSKTYSF